MRWLLVMLMSVTALAGCEPSRTLESPASAVVGHWRETNEQVDKNREIAREFNEEIEAKREAYEHDREKFDDLAAKYSDVPSALEDLAVQRRKLDARKRELEAYQTADPDNLEAERYMFYPLDDQGVGRAKIRRPRGTVYNFRYRVRSENSSESWAVVEAAVDEGETIKRTFKLGFDTLARAKMEVTTQMNIPDLESRPVSKTHMIEYLGGPEDEF